jgi:hypothetical protein
MNIPEGARRIQYVGRIMLIFSAGGFTLILLITLLARFSNAVPGIAFGIIPALVLSLYPGFIGLMFLIVGWIVEGFATPSKPDRPND